MDTTIQKQALSSGEAVHRGLNLQPPPESTYTMGSGKMRAKFGAAAALDLNPSGDWRKWLPKDELQAEYGFDPMDCAIINLLKGWIVLAKFYGFEDFPQEISERYVGTLCNVTPTGSDPIQNAELVRTYTGVIPAPVMPVTSDIDTWFEFYDRKMARALLSLGKSYLKKFDFGYQLVWKYEDKDKLTGKQKTELLRAALKRGPVSVTVSGNYRTRSSAYYKNDMEPDTHLTFISTVDNAGARIADDSYDPIIKRFEKDYNHELAVVLFLKRRESSPIRDWWDSVVDSFTSTWTRLSTS